MKAPPPFNKDRIRTVTKGFSWIDRRIITEAFLPSLSKEEIALYFFLVTAADRLGMSFWSHEKISYLLGIEMHELDRAIHGLVAQDLIAYRYPFFQVLSLPLLPSWRFRGSPLAKGRP